MSEKIKLIYCLSFLARNFRRLDKVGKASQFWSQFQLSFMNETFEFLVRNGAAVRFVAMFAQQIGVPLPALPWFLASGILIRVAQGWKLRLRRTTERDLAVLKV
jgi:hypothetical protein